MKSFPTDALRRKFKELRSRVKHLISNSRARFFETLNEDLPNNNKRFWSLFNLKTKDSSVPEKVSMKVSGLEPASVHSASCPRDVAEIFNVYFSSVLNNDHQEIERRTSPSNATYESSISELNLCVDDVLVALLNLDGNKATGPDGIPPRLLKETAHQIAPSLCSLFNQSLSSGSLPDEWKLANIIPIYKKGDKTHVENYRPISLCIISKVLERCVLSKLRDRLLNLMNTSQHGFIPGRSCTT